MTVQLGSKNFEDDDDESIVTAEHTNNHTMKSKKVKKENRKMTSGSKESKKRKKNDKDLNERSQAEMKLDAVVAKKKKFKQLKSDGEQVQTESKQEVDAIVVKLLSSHEYSDDDDNRSIEACRFAASSPKFSDDKSQHGRSTDNSGVGDYEITHLKGIKKKRRDSVDSLKQTRDIFGSDSDSEVKEKKVEDKIHSVPRSLTQVDNKVISTDMPERMQQRNVPVTAASTEELAAEAYWIYKQAFEHKTISIQDTYLNERGKRTAKKNPHIIPKIRLVLELMKNQHLEVPFIAFYRKEDIHPDLNMNDLWKIYKFDTKYIELCRRKEALLELVGKMKAYQESHAMVDTNILPPISTRMLKTEDLKRVKNAQTAEEICDLYDHFNFYYDQEIPKMLGMTQKQEKESKPEKSQNQPDELQVTEEEKKENSKQTIRVSPFLIRPKPDLQNLAKRFGLSPEQYAKNLTLGCCIHQVDQEEVPPRVLAAEYTCEKYQTIEDVLKAAQILVATQLSVEPLVRATLRKIYREKAKISVQPKKESIALIDENHPVYSMKYLKSKPVKNLVGDEFLKLVVAAEQENLITISFSDSIEGNSANNYVDEMKILYLRDDVSKTVQYWNTLRAESVEMAYQKILPDLQKELRNTLLNEAKEYVMRSCARKMYNWIKIAPYRCIKSALNNSKDLRVMGLAYTSISACLCMVGPNGEFLDNTTVLNAWWKKDIRSDNNASKKREISEIKNFVLNQKPHVIVIGGESIDALIIQKDVRDIVAGLVKDEGLSTIQVEIIDNEPAKVYASSCQSVSEFWDHSELHRQAISLARRLQDPLAEFAQLCNANKEILKLKFHSLQSQVPKEELLERINQEFINRVNEVGVDINKAARLPYLSNLVQFICGLGPQKAQHLISTLKNMNGKLKNRSQLITLCDVGMKVFINCAGFIKIDVESQTDETEVLDSTRIHPEAYDWVKKFIATACECKQEEADAALKEIFKSPKRLKNVDLNVLVENLENQGKGNKGITVYDVRSELTRRYQDLRLPYQSLTPDRLFDVLTKETPETFYIGRRVEATVTDINIEIPNFEQFKKNKNKLSLENLPGVKLRLHNGVSVYIKLENLSDSKISDPRERVRIGDRVHCRVIGIDVQKFCVEGSSKRSDLADVHNKWKPTKDPHFDIAAKRKDDLEIESTKKERKEIYKNLKNIHELFHDISYVDAEKLLESMHQGDIIFRPSTKGNDRFSISWKVADAVCQHVSVQKENKADKYVLGRGFSIREHKFDSVDDIVARYIKPMAVSAAKLIGCRFYEATVLGMRDMAEKMLREKALVNADCKPFIVSVSKKYPGSFMLSYFAIDKQYYHEYIAVTPKGFQFRKHNFSSTDELFQWFEKHCYQESRPITPGKSLGSRKAEVNNNNLPDILSFLNRTSNHTLCLASDQK